MNLGFEPDIDMTSVKQLLLRLRDSIKSRDELTVRDAIIEHFQIIKTGLLKSAIKHDADAERRKRNA
jgi:hypothetical protein